MGRTAGQVTSLTWSARPPILSTVGGVDTDSSVNVTAPFTPTFSIVIL